MLALAFEQLGLWKKPVTSQEEYKEQFSNNGLEIVDVCVIGAGVSGSSTATVLSSVIGVNVRMVDYANLGDSKIGESIPPTAKPILSKLGVLEAFEKEVEQNLHLICNGNKRLVDMNNCE